MQAHFGLPSLSSSDYVADDSSMTSSVFSGLMHPQRALAPDLQADTARLTNALNVVVEVNAKCWRGDDCELCNGVCQGLSNVARHTQQHGDVLEHRVSTYCKFATRKHALILSQARTLLYSTLEALKVRFID